MSRFEPQVVALRQMRDETADTAERRGAMNITIRDRWSEEEVVRLLATAREDYVSIKSGTLIEHPEFRLHMARSLCGLANAGGGRLVLGVDANGVPDGVPATCADQTPTRAWLQELIPELLDPRPEAWKVHEVEPARHSAIPSGRVLLVVEIRGARAETGRSHRSTVDGTWWYTYPASVGRKAEAVNG